MTEPDAEETVVPPAKAAKKPSRWTDRLLAMTGLALAAAAGFFPWYVFFNEDKFKIRVAAIDHTRDLPEIPAHNVFSVSPLAMVDKDDGPASRSTEPPVDPLVTATVSKLGKEKTGAPEPAEEQPFPGRAGFRLLHVANGRALIEDSAGMYLVRIGSVLPDKSRLASVEQRDGKWIIVTSKGDIVAAE